MVGLRVALPELDSLKGTKRKPVAKNVKVTLVLLGDDGKPKAQMPAKVKQMTRLSPNGKGCDTYQWAELVLREDGTFATVDVYIPGH